MWSGGTGYKGQSVTVELLKDGNSFTPAKTVTLSANNNWADSTTFVNLPLYDDRNDANMNKYSVREIAVDGRAAVNGRYIVYGTEENTGSSKTEHAYDVKGFWTSAVTKDTADSTAQNTVYTVTNTWTPAENTGEGKFTIQKYETGTTTPISGVQFKLEGASLTAPRYGTTDENGQTAFDVLPAGTYTLTETIPDGYTGTETYTIKVGDETESGNVLVDVENPTNTKNTFVNIWNWVVNKVAGGTKTKIGVDGTLIIYNTKVSGDPYDVPDSITVNKVDGNNEAITTDTATFTLTDTADSNVTYSANTSTVNGVATFNFGDGGISLTEGTAEGTVTKTFTLTETKAPNGYDGQTSACGTVTVIAETKEVLEGGKFVMKTTYTATIDGQTSKKVVNTKREAVDYLDATLTVTKTDDSAIHEPLSGAVFQLTDANGTVVPGYEMLTTNANGQIVLTAGNGGAKLAVGTYTLTEITPPTGFSLGSDTSWTVTVRDDDTSLSRYYATYTKADNTVVENSFVTVHRYLVQLAGGTEKTAETLSVENKRDSYTVTVTKAITGEDVELPEDFYISNSLEDDNTHFVIKAQPGATNEV